MTELELMGLQEDKEALLSYEERIVVMEVGNSMIDDDEQHVMNVPWRRDQPNCQEISARRSAG